MNTLKPENLDDIIRKSTQLDEQPSTQLNNILKAKVREKEAHMSAAQEKKEISLWYLPMILNGLIFITLAFMVLILIPNSFISQVLTGICIYLTLAGVILTLAAVKLSDFKTTFTIELNKGGLLT